MPVSYAVLFKVFFIDDFVLRRLQHLTKQIGTGHLYVVADETHGPLAIPYDRVIRVRDQGLLDMDLVAGPAEYSVIWYNADYVLYYCAEALPQYEYFITIEYDAVANADLDHFAAWAAQRGADFVGRAIDMKVEHWHWRQSCEGVYDPLGLVRPFLNCVALYSRKAARLLLERRRALSALYRAGTISRWPISEAFIATELALAGLPVVDLREYGAIPNLTWWPPLHESELPAAAGEAFIHPVLTGLRYVRSLLRYSAASSIFQPDSLLSRKLRAARPADYLPLVLPKLGRAATARCIALDRPDTLGELTAALTTHPEGLPNLAVNRHCTQSSLSEWSRGQDIHADAAGAVTGIVTGGYGFHTREEARPWWMVDLAAVHTLRELRVFNRLGFEDRAASLVISTSKDSEHWRAVPSSEPELHFGGADGAPLSVQWPEGQQARFVRLQLAARSTLHLDQVMVFGT